MCRTNMYVLEALCRCCAHSPAYLQDYFALLDEKCEYLKEVVGGGVGWFAHIYSDEQEPGYGIYNDYGELKFNFNPRTCCP